MNGDLVELFKHNLWANLCLLDACAKLGDEQLAAIAPGTYGSVRDTLMHLAGAEERYVARLTGQQPRGPELESEGFLGIAELRKRAQSSGEALIAIAEQFQPAQVLSGTWRGESYAIPAVVVLIQAINHATEHRSQVKVALSQQGIEPPEVDGWTYWQEAMPRRG